MFTGSVPWAELPAHYAAGDVYAMPCRTRAAGLDVEGLGIVYLEASATGLPVVAGDSGGAPDAVLRGRDRATWSAAATCRRSPDRLADLLADPDRARRWARRAGPGSSASGAGRSRPPGSGPCSTRREQPVPPRGGAGATGYAGGFALRAGADHTT